MLIRFRHKENCVRSMGKKCVYIYIHTDHLCGLEVRVPGYRSSGSGFDSRHYQIFWEVVVLGRGPLSLVSNIEELLGKKSSGSGLENREYGHRDPLRWPRDTFYPQKFALTGCHRYSQQSEPRLWALHKRDNMLPLDYSYLHHWQAETKKC
jgi:hypothetical protein